MSDADKAIEAGAALPAEGAQDAQTEIVADINTINTAAAHLVQVASRAFSGPLPPPEMLEHYQRVQPDLVERLMRLTEAEAAHRHEIETQALVEAARVEARGQHYGLAALAVALAALAMGHEKAAMTIGGTTVIGLAAVFVVGRWKQPTE